MKSLLKGLLYFSLCAVCVTLLLTTSFDAHAAAGAAAAIAPGAVSAAFAGVGGLSIQALRERRSTLAKETRDILDKHPKDVKLPDDASKKVDDLMAEIESLDGRIKQEQRLLDLTAEKHFKDVGGHEYALSKPSDPLRAVYQKWLRGGDKALNAEDWASIRNTMSTTTGSEGGYAVQSDVAKELIDSLKAFGGMRSVATLLQTAQGNPLSYPTSDGTAETGEWIAENTTATAADPTFGTKALNVYKASSKIVAVPFELLQDATIDIEAFVRGRLNTRLGRVSNTAYTVGSGSQPQGVVPNATAGKVGTTGQTTTVIFDDLVDLIHSVDPAYRASGKCVFMMNDASLAKVRKLKDSAGRPIFIPGWDGLAGPMKDTLLGYPVVVNQDMAVMTANAKSILFGDFSKYIIRDALDVQLFRFADSPYIKLGQIGFLAWMRTGGNLMDTAAVKYYQNSAT